MTLTNNDHRFYYDRANLLTIENDLILGKHPFYYAKDNGDILVVNKTNYIKIMEDLVK